MSTVLLPPVVNPIAVNKYIVSYYNCNHRFSFFEDLLIAYNIRTLRFVG